MAGSLIPAPIVPAPQPLRRRYGLFDAASGPLDLPAHGEGGGRPDSRYSGSAQLGDVHLV